MRCPFGGTINPRTSRQSEKRKLRLAAGPLHSLEEYSKREDILKRPRSNRRRHPAHNFLQQLSNKLPFLQRIGHRPPQCQAMNQNQLKNPLNIRRQNVIASVQQRRSLSRKPQTQRPARARTGLKAGFLTGRRHDIENKSQHRFLQIDPFNQFLNLIYLLATHNGIEFKIVVMKIRISQNLDFVIITRISHLEPHQKPTHLTLRKRKSPLIIDRILSRKNHKRFTDRVGAAIGRNFSAIHHLQQARLRLRSRAVDFVRQNNIGKDRTAPENKLIQTLVVNRNSSDIGRKQVTRKLNPADVTGVSIYDE